MSMLDDLMSEKTGYEEFRYIMQDSGSYYLGSRYTYEELEMSDNVPFKFRAVIEHYIAKDTTLDTALESHLYYLTGDMFSYKTLAQLRCRVKISILEPKKRLFKKTEEMAYREKTITIADLVNMNLAYKKGHGLVIQELIISKLALMSFSV